GLDTPSPGKSTVPRGYSSHTSPAPIRATASSPVGDQSAHITFSATSRGVPPAPGTNASVPFRPPGSQTGRTRTASSPVGDTARREVLRNPTAWAWGAVGACAKPSSGSPPHAALKMIRPSGLKRPAETLPTRASRLWTEGGGGRVSRPTQYIAVP